MLGLRKIYMGISLQSFSSCTGIYVTVANHFWLYESTGTHKVYATSTNNNRAQNLKIKTIIHVILYEYTFVYNIYGCLRVKHRIIPQMFGFVFE